MPQSSFLCEGALPGQGATPQEYMSSSYVNKSNYHQVGLGIVIENYSRFKLKLLSSDSQDCVSTRAIQNVSDIPKDRLEMFIFDNDGKTSRSICGSASWQILQPNGAPLKIHDEGRRLVLTYVVPYK